MISLIYQAFKQIRQTLAIFPTAYQEKLQPDRWEKFLDLDKEVRSLFLYTAMILPYIEEQEGADTDLEVLRDYVRLLMLIFYAYQLYDGVADHKKPHLLPGANILLQEAFALAYKHKIDLKPGLKTVELYNVSPQILKIGKIKLEQARKLDANWVDMGRGFKVLKNIIEDYVKRHIPGATYGWADFFHYFLIFRKFQDDANDFADDYEDGELTC